MFNDVDGSRVERPHTDLTIASLVTYLISDWFAAASTKLNRLDLKFDAWLLEFRFYFQSHYWLQVYSKSRLNTSQPSTGRRAAIETYLQLNLLKSYIHASFRNRVTWNSSLPSIFNFRRGFGCQDVAVEFVRGLRQASDTSSELVPSHLHIYSLIV